MVSVLSDRCPPFLLRHWCRCWKRSVEKGFWTLLLWVCSCFFIWGDHDSAQRSDSGSGTLGITWYDMKTSLRHGTFAWLGRSSPLFRILIVVGGQIHEDQRFLLLLLSGYKIPMYDFAWILETPSIYLYSIYPVRRQPETTPPDMRTCEKRKKHRWPLERCHGSRSICPGPS